MDNKVYEIFYTVEVNNTNEGFFKNKTVVAQVVLSMQNHNNIIIVN